MPNQPDNWFQNNPRKARWLVFLVCFAFVELLCRALVMAGFLRHVTYPTSSSPVFWDYIDPVVGMWRYPDARFHHDTDCIDQVYETNSVGARDPERMLASAAPRRMVVLGDSMVEGLGVARGERVTDLLEARTGIEHLNFGTSGNFGTIQEWLYYREYASLYDHSDVLVFLLPANDFNDNNPDKFGTKVYRPYLRPGAQGFELWYPVNFAERDKMERPLSELIKNTLDNNIYFFNALRVGTRMLKDKRKESQPVDTVSSYSRYTPDELAVMIYALNEIAVLAGERKVHLFTIPHDGDAGYAKQYGYNFPLVAELTAFAGQRANVEYHDLLPGMLSYAADNQLRFRDFSLGCDPHWSPLGNERVADLVFDWLYGHGAED